ncbi:hypothetical protein HTZ97_16305 [Desulfuromonas acetoxidans]|uniref:Uncharacterized protein n=1 Tax=Desulfuromonas acetoxidans (strain DSM 684 / 11070) TaxID=281689 RepID=Q1K065_DESA6|nr:hypothetical protein [Desulfuromonas acetoxidans]EAT16076.1 hypothetical protein Dace_2377 [Desulfuromonas acetoxidans DSM 684]MBF0646892.1 hypothetical protein [Desulfuromonas acetoxidans]NVD26169.1 hypothetical protein [Desulfuromonas acetoxidans]NVE18019.1 hypothetical protein [Desulfuromonas acetoxidans]
MSLHEQRMMLRGQLEEAKAKQRSLRLRVEGNAQGVCRLLNTTLTAADDLRVDLAAAQMDELQEAWAELTVINSQIDRLEKELA